MCGITGYMGAPPRADICGTIEEMLALMGIEGPIRPATTWMTTSSWGRAGSA